MIYLLKLESSCADYNFISILVILKRILSIMQVIVPIVLLLSCIWGLIQLMINPDDKKGLIRMKNKFIAALIFIFIPSLVSLTLQWTDDTFNIGACWATAEEYKAQLDDAEIYDVATTNNGKKSLLDQEGEYKFHGGSSENSSSNNLKGSAKGQEIVKYALQFVGKKYVYGGGHGNTTLEKVYSKKGGGVDCSGFTRLVYKHFGYSIAGSSSGQRSAGRSVPYSKAQAGDIIVYSGHVAIFMGDGNKIVHASNSQAYPKGGIKISNNAKYRNILSVRRIV